MTPVVWLVTAYRAGERAQILALAEALGWPFQIKEVSHKPYEWKTNFFRGSNLAGINLHKSDPLTAPWPDLVISAGMRNEPVCRWIQDQSDGRCKIVHIGRPWARLDNFDLVITTPQYLLQDRKNVLQNMLTLHRVTSERLSAAAKLYLPELSALPGPYIAVIVGGNSGPYTFGKRAASRLAEQCNLLAKNKKASLLVTTSARTSSDATAVLQAKMDMPKYFYRWKKNDERNPYYAYLAFADELVVTADSVSMLSEACATGKPVHMFDLGTGKQSMRRHCKSQSDNDFRLTGSFYRFIMKYGPKRASRDIQLVHDRIIADGHADWLSEDTRSAKSKPLNDIDRAVEQVKSLF